MQRVSKALLAVMTAFTFCFATCSKQDDIDNSDNRNISVQQLTGASNAVKKWYFAEITVSYYDASGVQDSAVYIPITDHVDYYMYFSFDTNGNGVSYTQDPASDYIPEFANWTFDAKNQTVNFVCNRFVGDCSAVPGGTWATKNYYASSAYGESFTLEQTQTTSGNGKKTVTIRLSANPVNKAE